MRRSDKEITDQEIIKSIIKDALVCRIGLVDEDEPYIVPVCFGITGTTLYFHSAQQGRKIDIIKKHPKICFEIESNVCLIEHEIACKWTFHYQSIMGTGKAEIINDYQEKVLGMSVIMDHYSRKEFTFPQESIDKTLVVKVHIETIVGKKSGDA